MSPAEYRRKRDRIEFTAGTKRGHKWGKRALAHLNREADAEPVIWGKKVVALRLDGRVVCKKQRYETEAEAVEKMRQIALQPDGRTKPIRAFACHGCLGWHLTSQAKRPD